MLWKSSTRFMLEPFEREAELETAIHEVADDLFGPSRIYLDVKKKIGVRGKTTNIPDGYLLDLVSAHKPTLYVVEDELASHDPLKHIAVQILEFSLSFESTPQKVKKAVKYALASRKEALKTCERYARENGFENLDFLLERMIYDGSLELLVIIDELHDELESVLVQKFKFPVEVLTLQRFKSAKGERIYQFDPLFFGQDEGVVKPSKPKVDLSDIDTIVVPARDEGFQDVFLGEDRWFKIRIHGSMIPKIRFVAAYRVAPTSAITHIAPVASIKPWKNSGKYVLNFSKAAAKIGPIRLVPKGAVKAPQGARYTARERLLKAKTLDDAF